jgi:SRSO17 transposase
MVTAGDVRGWAAALDGVVERIAPRFGRSEPRRRAGAYLRGLLAPVERKNGWQLAEAAGDATPDGVQEFLSRVRWDADAVRDDLQAYVTEHLGDPGAVLVLDETGFLKKGTKSAGVQRQYTGTAGRIENAQVGVFLGYAGQHGRALIDRSLYVPKDWAADDIRRRQARIPGDVQLVTKPKQGLAMLERARAAGVPFAWIAGDSVYGADSAIRRWAERHRCGYVLAVTSGQRLAMRPVTDWIEDLPADAWQRLSAGDGAKGPRLYDWAHLPYNGAAKGFACALLVRRSASNPEEITFYLTHAPQGTGLAELVRVAGTRWAVESLFEQAKGEVGLDQYEVRSWVGWHRHVTLSMFALAYLAVIRRNAEPGAAGGYGPGKSESGPVAAHRARGQAAHRGTGGPTASQARCRPTLVNLAQAPPATRQACPLAPTNTGTLK